MGKNNYLTADEQKLWNVLNNKGIIGTELAGQVFPELSENRKVKLLNSLCSKGYIKRAKKGVYYNPERTGSFYKLALRLHKGYIGLHSALKIHGLTEYEDFTIIILTRDRYMKVRLGDYTLKYMPIRPYNGIVERDGIMVSTLEKTFFDCFIRIRHVGYSILTKAIHDAGRIKWGEFLESFSGAPDAAAQKAGYVLEMLKKETGCRIPSYVFRELLQHVKHPVKLEHNSRKSSYDSRWKVQDNIGEKRILSWWYQ